MRGGALSQPDVIAALRPFIVVAVTARDEDGMPREVAALSRDQARRRTSNIHCYLLDSKGACAGSFAPFRDDVVDHQRLARTMKDEVARLSAGMDLPRVKEGGGLHLPDLSPGMRILMTLRNERVNQYAAPVVETAPIGERERKALVKPEKARDVDAAELRAWLAPLMPPAIMDGMGGLREVSGTLRLEPTGVLRGKVKLVLDDRNASVCEGALEGVVTWREGAFATLHAAFEGTFGKADRMRRGVMEFAMKAVLESRPE